MAITGTFGISNNNVIFPSNEEYGGFALEDAHPDDGDAKAYVIDEVKVIVGDTTFIQDALLNDGSSLPIEFWDRTYVGGTLVDGTYIGGIYTVRRYNPIDIYYSIIDSDGTSIGCSFRTPYSMSMGNFYANMLAPHVPGSYDIRWRYQKDSSSYVKEVRENFFVKTWGIDAQNP